MGPQCPLPRAAHTECQSLIPFQEQISRFTALLFLSYLSHCETIDLLSPASAWIKPLGTPAFKEPFFFILHECVHVKSLQSCLTLCDPMDHSPPGSSVHEIIQARILEWVATPFSRASSWPRDQTCASYVSYIVRQILKPLCHQRSPDFILFKLGIRVDLGNILQLWCSPICVYI